MKDKTLKLQLKLFESKRGCKSVVIYFPLIHIYWAKGGWLLSWDCCPSVALHMKMQNERGSVKLKPSVPGTPLGLRHRALDFFISRTSSLSIFLSRYMNIYTTPERAWHGNWQIGMRVPSASVIVNSVSGLISGHAWHQRLLHLYMTISLPVVELGLLNDAPERKARQPLVCENAHSFCVSKVRYFHCHDHPRGASCWAPQLDWSTKESSRPSVAPESLWSAELIIPHRWTHSR